MLTNPHLLMVIEYLAQALPETLGHLHRGFFIFYGSKLTFLFCLPAGKSLALTLVPDAIASCSA